MGEDTNTKQEKKMPLNMTILIWVLVIIIAIMAGVIAYLCTDRMGYTANTTAETTTVVTQAATSPVKTIAIQSEESWTRDATMIAITAVITIVILLVVILVLGSKQGAGNNNGAQITQNIEHWAKYIVPTVIASVVIAFAYLYITRPEIIESGEEMFAEKMIKIVGEKRVKEKEIENIVMQKRKTLRDFYAIEMMLEEKSKDERIEPTIRAEYGNQLVNIKNKVKEYEKKCDEDKKNLEHARTIIGQLKDITEIYQISTNSIVKAELSKDFKSLSEKIRDLEYLYKRDISELKSTQKEIERYNNVGGK